jgi:hypothetical protein
MNLSFHRGRERGTLPGCGDATMLDLNLSSAQGGVSANLLHGLEQFHVPRITHVPFTSHHDLRTPGPLVFIRGQVTGVTRRVPI